MFRAIEIARVADSRVAYGTTPRLQRWPLACAHAVIHAAVAGCDIALPGRDDAVKLAGSDDPDMIADVCLGLGWGLTLGADGTLVATRDRRNHVPALRVEAADATGAGCAPVAVTSVPAGGTTPQGR